MTAAQFLKTMAIPGRVYSVHLNDVWIASGGPKRLLSVLSVTLLYRADAYIIDDYTIGLHVSNKE